MPASSTGALPSLIYIWVSVFKAGSEYRYVSRQEEIEVSSKTDKHYVTRRVSGKLVPLKDIGVIKDRSRNGLHSTGFEVILDGPSKKAAAVEALREAMDRAIGQIGLDAVNMTNAWIHRPNKPQPDAQKQPDDRR